MRLEQARNAGVLYFRSPKCSSTGSTIDTNTSVATTNRIIAERRKLSCAPVFSRNGCVRRGKNACATNATPKTTVAKIRSWSTSLTAKSHQVLPSANVQTIQNIHAAIAQIKRENRISPTRSEEVRAKAFFELEFPCMTMLSLCTHSMAVSGTPLLASAPTNRNLRRGLRSALRPLLGCRRIGCDQGQKLFQQGILQGRALRVVFQILRNPTHYPRSQPIPIPGNFQQFDCDFT